MKIARYYFNVLIKSLIAGIAISIGGFCYLKIAEMGFPGAKVVGAIFFAIGLILICNFGEKFRPSRDGIIRQ
jgi:formate/nitrite transporter FocA (FNT family)